MADIAEMAERQEQLARDVSIRIRQAAIEKERRTHCVDCGDKIPPERQKAINAIRCVKCQGKREKR